MVTEKDVQFLENHLSENPESILFARLADAYLQLEKVDDAIKICEDGIKKYPFYATGHYVLVRSYLAKKLYEQAEKEFKRVLLFDPKFLTAHKNYGDLMKEIGWENTCEMSYRKIVQIDPLDDSAREVVREFDVKNKDAVLQDGERSFENEQPENLQEDLQNAEIEMSNSEKIEKIDSMEVSAVEDELLFEQEEESENPFATGEKNVQENSESAEADADLDIPELNKEKEEEFSYLLDDIFKDEVAEENRDNGDSTLDDELSDTDITTVDDIDTKPVLTESDIEEDLQHAVSQQGIKRESTHQSDNDTPEPELDDINLHSNEGESNNNIQPDVDFETTESTDTEYPDPFGDIQPPSIENELKKSKKAATSKKKNNSEKIVTPTLGEIYTAQGQYGKAIDVFETLLKKYPDNEFYLKKIENLRHKLAESKDAES